MGIGSAGLTFYQKFLVPTWHAIKGVFKGKSAAKVEPDPQALIGPHQQFTDIHQGHTERKVRQQSGIERQVLPAEADDSVTTLVSPCQYKDANGQEYALGDLSINSPAALIRLTLALRQDISLSQLSSIAVNGQNVDENTPLWGVSGAREQLQVTLKPKHQDKDRADLEADLKTLLLPLNIVEDFDESESIVELMDDLVLNICHAALEAEVIIDEDFFTELQGDIDQALDNIADTPLKDRGYARSYLFQLQEVMKVVRGFDYQVYHEHEANEPAKHDYSLPEGASLKIDSSRLMRAIRGHSSTDRDAESTTLTPSKTIKLTLASPESVSPEPASPEPESPPVIQRSNLGFDVIEVLGEEDDERVLPITITTPSVLATAPVTKSSSGQSGRNA